MKKIIMLTAIALLITTQCLALDSDKKFHLTVSGLFGAGVDTLMFHNDDISSGPVERIVYSGMIGLLPGLGKELYDSTRDNNEFSGEDMVANAIGAFVGAALTEVMWGTISFRHDGRQTSLFFTSRF